MGILKKVQASFRKKAEDGYKSRQGNYPKEETKSSSSDESSYKDRQGQTSKNAPNKFPEAKAPEKKAESFGEAFKRNRAAGAKTFTHNGKSYTTETKEESTKKSSAKPLGNRPPAKSAADPSPASKLTSGPKTPSTGIYTSPGKPAGKSTPINTSAKARKGLPPMKTGGKTKKK